jgi:hypothetical protein
LSGRAGTVRVFFALALLAWTGTGPELLPAPPVEQPPRSERAQFVLAGGERLADRRLALSFALPGAATVRIQPRGIFYSVEIVSAAAEDYYLYHTSYRIRRGLDPATLAAALPPPCGLPEIPDADDFDVYTRCAGAIEQNEIVRHLRLIRRAEVLHLVYLACRDDAQDLAGAILASVREN